MPKKNDCLDGLPRGARIACYGGSFNPPGIHHVHNAKRVAAWYLNALDDRPFFDRVIVRPCGKRPDKRTTGETPAIHRAAMADIAFGGLSRCTVDLSDLEGGDFTPNIEIETRYRAAGIEVWHVVGTDLIAGGAAGKSEIQRWVRGAELWATAKFFVIKRGAFDRADLPPNHLLLEEGMREGASHVIRERVFAGKDVDGLVCPRIAAYIARHGLYRGALLDGPIETELDLSAPLVVADPHNPASKAMAETLGLALKAPRKPTCVIAIGGDGTMLRAMRSHWRLRLPFFGINTGHRGFHMNSLGEHPTLDRLRGPLKGHRLPMLHVTYADPKGVRHEGHACQDAWMQSAFQAVWLEIRKNGRPLFDRFVGDAAIVSTALGSSGYAESTGAQIRPITSRHLTLAGASPASHTSPPWRQPPLLEPEDRITFRNLMPGRRKPRIVVDGVVLGPTDEVDIRTSAAAGLEIYHLPGYDQRSKLEELMRPT